MSHVGYRKRRIFTLLNEVAGNILVHICCRLCKSFSRRLGCWFLGVTEGVIVQIFHLFLPNPNPSLLHPLWSGRTMCLLLANEMAADGVGGASSWKYWEADWGVSSVSSTAPAIVEAAAASVKLGDYVAQKPWLVGFVSCGWPTLALVTDLWGHLLCRMILPA